MPDKKISQMDPDTSLDGSEVVPVVQSGNKRTTTGAIAGLAPGTNLTYDPATRLLSSSTGEDVTLPLVNTTAAGLIPHTWLTGAEPATFPHIHGALAGVVYEHVRNVSGSAMAALTPYHVVGSQGDTDRVQIIPANASDPASMPASGILVTALANNEDGHGVIAGVPIGLDTAANPSGTTLYVGTGVLTPTAPAANVQAIAIVGRSHASTGTLSMIGGPSLPRVAYTGDYGDLLNPPSIFDPAAPGAIGGTTPDTGQFTGVGLGGVPPRTGYSAVLGSGVLPRAQIVTAAGSTYSCDIRAATRFMLAAAVAGNITIDFSNVADLQVSGNSVEYAEVQVDFQYTSGVITISAGGFTTVWDGNTAAAPTAGEFEQLIVQITPAIPGTPFTTPTVKVAPMKGNT